MRVYVVLKTFRADSFQDIFPNVIAIDDTIEEAIGVIADECDTTVEEVENELEENNCYDIAQARYTIFKYVN